MKKKIKEIERAFKEIKHLEDYIYKLQDELNNAKNQLFRTTIKNKLAIMDLGKTSEYYLKIANKEIIK